MLVTTTSFQIADVGKITATQAVALNKQLGTSSLVQNGAGNVFQPGASSTAIGTFVQNTLNNQNIQTRTVINSTTNGMSLVKGIDTAATLRDSLLNSIGNRQPMQQPTASSLQLRNSTSKVWSACATVAARTTARSPVK